MTLLSSARYILACGVLLIAVLLCFPQSVTAQDDDDVVRVNTDLVLLNVTVTDKTGQYVRALKATDFKVYEDGTEVPAKSIVSFDVQESPYAAVVLLDSSGSMETRFSLARSAAIRFLDGLREEDVAAVYHSLRRRFVLRTGSPLPVGAYTVRYLVDTERPDLPTQGPTKAEAVRGTVGVH